MLETKMDCFDFGPATIDRLPFPHFSVSNFASEELGQNLLNWFESDAIWKTHNQDGFYESYDLSLRDSRLPLELECLVQPLLIDDLRGKVAALFRARLDERVDVTAHKLVPSYRIGIHTDFGETNQTHRLLIQFNRGWRTEMGGLLLFLSSKVPSQITGDDRVFVPYHRRAICFEVSNRSFHAVTPVNDGERFTLCFSFYSVRD